jgi:hypothetical protein
MRPQFLIDAVFVALVEKVEVLRPERRQEAVGIEELAVFAVGILRPQLVAEDLFARDEQLEESLGRDHRHRVRRRPGPVELDHRAFDRRAHERPHHHAGHPFVRQRMHAQPAMRIGLMILQKRVQFFGRYDHGGCRHFARLGFSV